MKALTCGLILLLCVACKDQKPPALKSPPAAKVITEDSLSTIVLSPEAEKRLGIVTVRVSSQKVARTRQARGDLILPLAAAGQDLESSKSIFSLLPSMTSTEMIRVAEMQIEADGKVAAAEVDLNAAKLNLERAVNLVANKAGAQRSVDDLRAQLQLTELALRTARERRALLGEPIFSAIRAETLWVRVPVYAGDLDAIDSEAPAQITTLAYGTNRAAIFGHQINVPISQATGLASVDLFYKVENKAKSLRPGQRVSVSIPLKETTESLVAPKAAVLYDIHGGEWVYENTAPGSFIRRRIQIRFSHETNVVLARGPAVGAKVVTAGAAELFGTEFGIGN